MSGEFGLHRNLDPAPEQMLDWGELTSKVEAMKALAAEHLEGATTMDVTLWDDGTASIEVFHVGGELRTGLAYHTAWGEVVGGVYHRETGEVYLRDVVAEIGTVEPTAGRSLEDVQKPIANPEAEPVVALEAPEEADWLARSRAGEE